MDRQEFLKGYSDLVWNMWETDGQLKDRLLNEPVAVLKEFGLDPGGASLNIITEIVEEGSLDDQVRMWNEGLSTGSIDLYVPLEKPADLSDIELSDADLEAVAGGAGDCCCSCSSPCCSCS
ncbi:MAG: hypothetical protein GTO14_07675 [Anaerolineales bacterium]|nr:hypothetical protein [Anaerolineales bacterium]